MSKLSKSPKKVATAAFRIAARTLPQYSHRFSPKKYTQPQLFTCLVLKIIFKTDYRGIAAILSDCSDLTKAINIRTVPHYTTLQKASQRLLNHKNTQKLLAETVSILLNNEPDVELAALDATGLESGHISPYFYSVREKAFKHRKCMRFTRWPKLAIIIDVIKHFIITAYPTRGPGSDSLHFKDILSQLPDNVTIKHLVADASYDAENNHVFAREELGIKTIIPPKIGRATKNLPKSKYRKLMKLEFNQKEYNQRWQVETVFSIIKRVLGYTIKAKLEHSQNAEMLLIALTYNLAVILFVFQRAFLQSTDSWFVGGPALMRKRTA